MKLKNVWMIASVATLVATSAGKAQDTTTTPQGRTAIEVTPGETVIETAPSSTTTVITPSVTVEPAPVVMTEPAGASVSMADRFRYEKDEKDLYDGDEFTFDLAGAYGVGRGNFGDVDESYRRDQNGNSGKFGASIGVNYFFTKMLGVGVDAYGLDNNGKLVDAASSSLILRFPIDLLHLAPYIFGGGGRTFEGPDTWTAHVGAGVELRLNAHTGIFADGRYVFAERESASDASVLRAGLRFAF